MRAADLIAGIFSAASSLLMSGFSRPKHPPDSTSPTAPAHATTTAAAPCSATARDPRGPTASAAVARPVTSVVSAGRGEFLDDVAQTESPRVVARLVGFDRSG